MAEQPLPEFDKAMAEWNESMARWRVTFEDFGKHIERVQYSCQRVFTRLFARFLSRPTLSHQLATCRADLHASERARTSLKAQLDHYIGQAIRARAERDRAERELQDAQACLLEALRERTEAYRAGLAQVQELALARRDAEDRRMIADRLQTELRELRAAVTIGAAQRKRGRA